MTWPEFSALVDDADEKRTGLSRADLEELYMVGKEAVAKERAARGK